MISGEVRVTRERQASAKFAAAEGTTKKAKIAAAIELQHSLEGKLIQSNLWVRRDDLLLLSLQVRSNMRDDLVKLAGEIADRKVVL